MSKKYFWIFSVLVGVIIIAGVLLAGQLLSDERPDHVVSEGVVKASGGSTQQCLGIVKKGMFYPLWPEKSLTGAVRLTKIQMQEAVAPESRELDLKEFEGKAVMISGHGGGGGWIYEAQVIDSAGPIVTLLVVELMSDKDKR